MQAPVTPPRGAAGRRNTGRIKPSTEPRERLPRHGETSTPSGDFIKGGRRDEPPDRRREKSSNGDSTRSITRECIAVSTSAPMPGIKGRPRSRLCAFAVRITSASKSRIAACSIARCASTALIRKTRRTKPPKTSAPTLGMTMPSFECAFASRAHLSERPTCEIPYKLWV
jgi:hypothetical protein